MGWQVGDARSALGARVEVELGLAILHDAPATETSIIPDMGEPANTTSREVLELAAKVVENLVVTGLAANARDSTARVGLPDFVSARPTGLREEDFLASVGLGDAVDIAEDARASVGAVCGVTSKEGQDVELSGVDSVEDIGVVLKQVGHLGSGDLDAFRLDARANAAELIDKLAGRDRMVEQGLRAECDGVDHVLGTGVGVDGVENTVEAILPLGRAIEAAEKGSSVS